MQVFVNQKPVDLTDGATIASLVEQMGMQDLPIAVAIGRQVVKRSAWGETVLSADSQVSIISICKGG